MYELHEEVPRTPLPAAALARRGGPHVGMSSQQEEALARLRFLVDSQRRLGLLLGEQARAKSQLLEGFSRELACDGHAVALVNLCSAGPGEMLWQIAECLGGKPGAEDDIGRLWRCLTDRLAANRHQQRTTVILLDDVDQAGADYVPGTVASHIVRLAQQCPQGAARLTLVVAADVRRAANLGQRIADLASLRIELVTPKKAIAA